MHNTIQIEQDGPWFIGSFSDIPGCYVQGRTFEEAKNLLGEALTIMVESYNMRQEPLNFEPDVPVVNKKIRFRKISGPRLARVLKDFSFHLEQATEEFILMRSTEFPFRRLLFPNASDLAEGILRRIFGNKNVFRISEEQKTGQEKKIVNQY